MAANRKDALRGVLLGTAVGDALGLPMEGMHSAAIRRRFGDAADWNQYRLFGPFSRLGIVSDDTEQSALVAQSLLRGRRDGEFDADAVVRAFRRALVGWFLRLPFGIGLGTLRACLKIALGLRNSGVDTAGNGAVMRAPILGVVLADRPELRREIGKRLARVTHLDPRAIDGALFAAELAAHATIAAPDADPRALIDAALAATPPGALVDAVADACAGSTDSTDSTGSTGSTGSTSLGTSGFVMHTAPLTAVAFARYGGDPASAIRWTIAVGGDTDTHAAIVGAWCGALHGEAALPAEWRRDLAGGPFGPRHLAALADALARPDGVAPAYSATLALLRNLALYPVVLAHGFRRLVK